MVSWGHMIEALNKLDVGSQEHIVLLSRNEIDMLVVSYADMKRCLETCFQEVTFSCSSTSPGIQTNRHQRPSTYFR